MTTNTSGGITIGTNNLNFEQFSGAGQIDAGTGLTKSGNTLSLDTNINTAGTLGSTGDFAVATNKFTVASATGNTAIPGALSSTGDFAVASDKFTVASGNWKYCYSRKIICNWYN